MSDLQSLSYLLNREIALADVEITESNKEADKVFECIDQFSQWERERASATEDIVAA